MKRADSVLWCISSWPGGHDYSVSVWLFSRLNEHTLKMCWVLYLQFWRQSKRVRITFQLLCGYLQCMPSRMQNPHCQLQGSPLPPPRLTICKEKGRKCRHGPRSSLSRLNSGYSLRLYEEGATCRADVYQNRGQYVFCWGLTAAEGSYLCHLSTFYSVINRYGCLPLSDVLVHLPLFYSSPPSLQVS